MFFGRDKSDNTNRAMIDLLTKMHEDNREIISLLTTMRVDNVEIYRQLVDISKQLDHMKEQSGAKKDRLNDLLSLQLDRIAIDVFEIKCQQIANVAGKR